MEKIWLKHYPKGVPAEIDVNEYGSVRDVFEESVAKYSARKAFTCMGKSITFAELDVLSRAFGAWLQAQRLQQGRARRDHDAQHPAVPDLPVRRPARGLHGRERQPAVHGARARAPAEGLRRRGDRRRRELRAGSCRKWSTRPRCSKVVVTSIGELLGFKGIAVNFVLRRVKKMVPKWKIPGSHPALVRAGGGPQAPAREASRSRTTTSRSCSTPAARPAWPRARCCCTGTSSPTCCRRGPGSSRSSTRTSPRSSSPRCRCTTSSR